MSESKAGLLKENDRLLLEIRRLRLAIVELNEELADAYAEDPRQDWASARVQRPDWLWRYL